MKKCLFSGISFFLALSATLVPQFSESCEIYDHCKHRIDVINHVIYTWDDEILFGTDMNFHLGSLYGQRQAYYEILTLIDDLYPN